MRVSIDVFLILWLMTVANIKAEYKITNCYECSRDLNFVKICNLNNNSPTLTPLSASPYNGACCSSDDTSQFCKP